jgi:uncharacterized protein (TIGR00255 family)
MVESMTGHAVGRWAEDGDLLVLEARSVNGKYLSLKFRLPAQLSVFEPRLEGLAKERLTRGNVVISCLEFAGFTDPEAGLRVNREVLGGYLRAASELPPEVERGLSAYELFRLPGVIDDAGGAYDAQRLERALISTAAQTLDDLVESRRGEGEVLREKVELMLDRLGDDLRTLELHASEVPQKIKKAVEERVSELAKIELDRERLEQEVAYLAAKADVTEELDRLQGHLGAFRSALDSEQSQGRRLDFLCQEMHRELNTCGSKAVGTRINPLVLEMKVTLDRIREQTANIA